jgi:hypothetical protein
MKGKLTFGCLQLFEHPGDPTDILDQRDRDCCIAALMDNALARQAIEDVGFGRVIEAGLGRGPQDFLGIDLHTFPASRPAREVWSQAGLSDADITLPAYRAVSERSGNRCGTIRLAGRSIGAPFVGSAAAALAISELVRLCMGGNSYELVSVHLRDLRDLTAVVAPASEAFNFFTPPSPISAPAFSTSSPNQDIRFDEFAPQAVWSSARNTTAHQATREAVDRKASIRTCKAADLSE